MNILNLAYPEKGTVEFKKLLFPDGQQDIVIERIDNPDGDIEIISRMNGFRDLELIICVTKALEEMGDQGRFHLNIPYLLGARSDRVFVPGGTHYLRDVISPIINSLDFNSVTILDPHSDVTEALVTNIIKEDNIEFVVWAVKQIQKPIGWSDRDNDNLVIISPDAGSLKKIYPVAATLGIRDIVVAMKHREVSTGKILSTEVPLNSHHLTGKNFLIIDDICDGGRTFIEIAKQIKGSTPEARIYLIVTHGIFSAGFEELWKYFEHIYTTNSIRDLSEEYFAIGHQLISVSRLITQMDVL